MSGPVNLAGVHLFPVRHHSPRAAQCLRVLLDEVRPALVLVEGPADADALVPVLTAPDSEPPIAILAYRTDGTPQSAMWPFARYSPEYQALLWAREHGVAARFIDWPAGVALAADAARAPACAATVAAETGVAEGAEANAAEADEADGEAGPGAGPQAPAGNRHDALAAHFGLRHFDEFWDAFFETPVYRPQAFREALNAYAEWTAPAHARDPESALRDQVMGAAIAAAVAAGTPPDRIVAVLGAAHVAALLRGDPPPSAQPPAPLPVALAVVPYSYPRLSEQSGYGAGNRAPWYYERAFEGGNNFARASLVVLIEFAGQLRARGFAVSLADVIEAYRLALTLAAIRGKSAPGVDELAEAAQATLARGEPAPIREFLTPLMIGRRIGKLAASAGRNSLQVEFAQSLAKYGLPQIDEPETVSLRLADATQAGASLFLHRLRVADVPYASYAGSQSVLTRGRAADDEAGGYGALSRVREHWEVQWTPATEVALAERVIWGERFAEVCERRINEAIGTAAHAADATRLLVDAVLTEATQATARALDAAERLASLDEDVASLAQAARTLAALGAYGSSRPALTQVAGTIERLLTGTFTRAMLRLALACRGDEQASAPARAAMRALHELALSQPLLDRGAWMQALSEIAADEALEPTASGVAAALLYLARELAECDLRGLLERRLGDVVQPARAADFLAGFFDVNALVLLKNREIVAALSDFLAALPAEQFRDALPALRRAFAVLGASERRFLLEHLVGLHGRAAPAAAAQVLTAADQQALGDLGAALGQALDDLDDLL